MQAGRWQEICERLENWLQKRVDTGFIEEIYKAIHQESIKRQEKSLEMHKPGQIVLSEDFALLHNLVPEGSRVAVLYDRNVEQWLERMADMRLLPMDEKEA